MLFFTFQDCIFSIQDFLTNHLNVHIIRGEHFESNVEEAVILSIHKD